MSQSITPSVTISATTWFNGGASYPPGVYRISYVTGCLQFSLNNGWVVSTASPQYGYHITDGNGNDLFFPCYNYKFPVTDSDPQAECVAANAGYSILYNHRGGKVGMYLADTNYTDNVAGTEYGNPTFSLPDTPMATEQHGFSTGVLTLTPLLKPIAASVQPAGGGAVVAKSSLVAPGGSPATLASATTRSASAWAIIDLGSAAAIASVALYACSDLPSGGAGARAWVCNDPTLVPAATGTTDLGVSSTVTGTPSKVTFNPASPVTGRYILVGPSTLAAGVSMSFAGILAYGSPIQMTDVQDATVDVSYDATEMYTSAGEAVYPVDVAFDGGKMTLKAGNLGMKADAYAQIAKSQLSGTTPLVNTVGPNILTVPEGILTFAGQDTAGKSIAYILQHAQSKGVSWVQRQKQFWAQDVTFFSIANPWDSVVGYMQMRQ